MRPVSDGHLALLHGLEECRLHLGSRSVDLIGQDEVGKDGSLAHGELARVGVVDLGTHQIRRQQVGSELQAVELRVNGLRHAGDSQGLGQTRDTLKQNVPTRQETEGQALDEALLANDHLGQGQLKLGNPGGDSSDLVTLGCGGSRRLGRGRRTHGVLGRGERSVTRRTPRTE